MFEWLSINWFSIVTLAVGSAITYIVTKVFSNKKRLTYQIINTEILSSKAAFPDGLSIKYYDVPVTGLYKTVYYVWNSGNVTIKGDDIAKSDALRCNISSSVCMIDVSSFQESKKACAVKVTAEKIQDNAFINIYFDYLDRNDGFRFALIHDATSPPIINGCISGTKIILSKESSLRGKNEKLVSLFSSSFMILLTGTLVYGAISNPIGVLSYIVAGFFVVFSVAAFYFTGTFRHKTPPKSITK